MDKCGEEWAPTSVTSTFKIPVETTDKGQRPTSVGSGDQYSAICGFGWRFSVRVEEQDSPTVVVDDAGEKVSSFQLILYFDPFLVRSISWGIITLTTSARHLIPASQEPPPQVVEFELPNDSKSNLGTYIYPSNAPVPFISFTVAFPATLGITLPSTLSPNMEHALKDTLDGKELVDLKFYAFSRWRTHSVSHPQSLYANSALLRGFSEDLDALLDDSGFSESAIVDLDQHKPAETTFDRYGYESDSDLDTDDETDTKGAPSAEATPAATSEAKLTTQLEVHHTASGKRLGRVIVLKDTAFRTWKTLLYYLYTGRVNFRPLKSEGSQEAFTANGPGCSPKSMYRLADKMGLKDLQFLALASLTAKLIESNILDEVFSSFTSMYPSIQDLETDVLVKKFLSTVTARPEPTTDKNSESSGSEVTTTTASKLRDLTRKICDGDKPHAAETLRIVMEKMAAPRK